MSCGSRIATGGRTRKRADMATSATTFPDSQRFERVRAGEATTVPWSLYAVLFASASVIVGVIWDISWHRSIGRDTFWTPAHMGIYLGGIVAGLTSGWLALRTTFAGSETDRGDGGAILGIPRAARRLGLHLGRVRHGHVGTVRRLVAQRLRPRRQDHQPAAYAARRRHRRHPVRRDADGAGLAEPRGRRSTAARTPVSARRRSVAAAGGDRRHRAHAALGHAPLAFLSGQRGRRSCSSSSARRGHRWPAGRRRRSRSSIRS